MNILPEYTEIICILLLAIECTIYIANYSIQKYINETIHKHREILFNDISQEIQRLETTIEVNTSKYSYSDIPTSPNLTTSIIENPTRKIGFYR